MADDIMTLPEAADYMRVHTATLRRWITQGLVPVAKVGGRVLVRKAALDEVVRQHEQRRRPRATPGAKAARDEGDA
jgi:excisionase family DNA binding protein